MKMDTLMRMWSAYEIAQTRKREKLIRVGRVLRGEAWERVREPFNESEAEMPVRACPTALPELQLARAR